MPGAFKAHKTYMTGVDLIAIVFGLILIGAINWWFLFSRAGIADARDEGGVQEAVILVKGGYSPAQVRVRRGARVRLVFDRRERAGCSEEVVLPAFGVRRFLPPGRRTAVEFTPVEAGEFEFTCGMGMLRGKVIVE